MPHVTCGCDTLGGCCARVLVPCGFALHARTHEHARALPGTKACLHTHACMRVTIPDQAQIQGVLMLDHFAHERLERMGAGALNSMPQAPGYTDFHVRRSALVQLQAGDGAQICDPCLKTWPPLRCLHG